MIGMRPKPGRMRMAWGRIVELVIGPGGFGLLISDLDIEFEIEKTMKLSENFARFKVYNASANTRNNILIEGNNVTFSAGYEDEGKLAPGSNTIFVGQIDSATTKKIGPDWVTDIKAVTSRGKGKTINTIPITLNVTKGTPLSTVITTIATSLGLVTFGLENTSDIILQNGWCYMGTTNGALRYIQKILKNEGRGIYFDDDELVVFNIGIPSKVEVVVLTYTGGLLNVEDITEKPEESKAPVKKRVKKVPKEKISKKIRYESILIPQLQLNAPVTLINTSQDGTYINIKVTYEGDNFGGDFKCKGEAIIV
jgi:hypothetical protein